PLFRSSRHAVGAYPPGISSGVLVQLQQVVTIAVDVAVIDRAPPGHGYAYGFGMSSRTANAASCATANPRRARIFSTAWSVRNPMPVSAPATTLSGPDRIPLYR